MSNQVVIVSAVRTPIGKSPTYFRILTSVGLVDLLNHPGHHGVYTISFHLFLRPNYCPHWEHMDCLV